MTLYLVFEAIKEGKSAKRRSLQLHLRIRPPLIFMKFLIIKLSLVDYTVSELITMTPCLHPMRQPLCWPIIYRTMTQMFLDRMNAKAQGLGDEYQAVQCQRCSSGFFQGL